MAHPGASGAGAKERGAALGGDLERLAASLPAGWDPGRDLVVCVGRGHDRDVETLLENGQGRVIVWLPKEASAAALHPRATVVTDAAELLAAVLALPGAAPQRASVRRSKDPWIAPGLDEEIARRVQQALHSKRLQHVTVDRSGATWLRQSLESADLVARIPSIEALRGAFAKRACVLVSPGPSLEKNVRRLVDLKGKALIVAGTHSLAVLRRAGVAPDVVVASDPGDLTRHFEPHDLEGVSAAVLATVCRREMFELPVPLCFAFAGNGPADQWLFDLLGEEARLPSGGSVACSQLSLALHLDCDPIVLVGQDLAFSEGRYYARGGVDGEATVVASDEGRFFLKKPAGSSGIGTPMKDGTLQFTKAQRWVEVPGYDGGTVRTSESFRAFLTWFEAIAASERERRLLVNATEGGARIEGMERLPLARVAEVCAPERVDAAAVLAAAGAAVDPEARAARLGAELGKRSELVDACLQLAGRAEAATLQALSNPRTLPALETIERELARRLADLRFVSVAAQGELHRAQEAARAARSPAAALQATLGVHRAARRALELVREPLRAAAERLG